MKKVKEKTISIKFKTHKHVVWFCACPLSREYILKGWFLLKKKKTCEIITKDFLVKRQE